MAKIGRNDPCPCGSGKKYKQCHGPIDAAREAEVRLLRKANDSLTEKVMDQAAQFADEFSAALGRFWNNKYRVSEIEQLDDLEERGAERFLTWFMFDSADATGRSPIQRLADDPVVLELDPTEETLLPTWADVRLRPYEISDTLKGQGLVANVLWDDTALTIEDQAAARRVEPGEVLIVHLTPVGEGFLVAGAAAHLSADTVPQLREWLELHLEQLRSTRPDATYDDLIRERSEILNHFVMALPREEQEANQLQLLIDNTRVLMAATGASLGLARAEEEQPRLLVPSDDADEAEEADDETDDTIEADDEVDESDGEAEADNEADDNPPDATTNRA